MMLFLYNMPSTEMGLIVTGATISAVLLCYAFFRHLCPVQLDAEQRTMALAMLSIVTTINSLLVAFAAVGVWDAYNDADRTVTAEAACAEELARDLTAFEMPQADAASRALHAYIGHVIRVEWPIMQQTLRPDPDSARRLDQVFDLANQIAPETPRQSVLLGEVLRRVNEMVKLREQRLQALQVAMPLTLWAVLLLVSGLSFILLYALPPTPFYIGLISAWAATLGLAFFFVLVVDHPYAGEFSVSSAPLQQTIDRLVSNHVWASSMPE